MELSRDKCLMLGFCACGDAFLVSIAIGKERPVPLSVLL